MSSTGLLPRDYGEPKVRPLVVLALIAVCVGIFCAAYAAGKRARPRGSAHSTVPAATVSGATGATAGRLADVPALGTVVIPHRAVPHRAAKIAPPEGPAAQEASSAAASEQTAPVTSETTITPSVEQPVQTQTSEPSHSTPTQATGREFGRSSQQGPGTSFNSTG